MFLPAVHVLQGSTGHPARVQNTCSARSPPRGVLVEIIVSAILHIGVHSTSLLGKCRLGVLTLLTYAHFLGTHLRFVVQILARVARDRPTRLSIAFVASDGTARAEPEACLAIGRGQSACRRIRHFEVWDRAPWLKGHFTRRPYRHPH